MSPSVKHTDEKWPLGGAAKYVNCYNFWLDYPILTYEVCMDSELKGETGIPSIWWPDKNKYPFIPKYYMDTSEIMLFLEIKSGNVLKVAMKHDF